MAVLTLAGWILVLAGGCAKEPYAATTNLTLTDEESRTRQELSTGDDRKVSQTLGSVAAGQKPDNPPGPAPHGMRWSDVRRAVDAACSEVEIAVTKTQAHDWGFEFTLTTIEDYPGKLIVKNVGPPEIYTATATVGLFKNHTDRAEALLKALHESMLAFGKKRGFNEPSLATPAPGVGLQN